MSSKSGLEVKLQQSLSFKCGTEMSGFLPVDFLFSSHPSFESPFVSLSLHSLSSSYLFLSSSLLLGLFIGLHPLINAGLLQSEIVQILKLLKCIFIVVIFCCCCIFFLLVCVIDEVNKHDMG